MFGTYRTILALLVVMHHLLSIPVIGHYAVHGFFILSGYLMTYIMSNTYGYTFNGVKKFAFNRFLRLYPSYWFILILSVLTVLIVGEDNSIQYRQFIYLPDTAFSLFQNITLLYFNTFPGDVTPRLSPPTWALTVELSFYFLVAIGCSKSSKITNIWFSFSVIYMLITHAFSLGYDYRYSAIFAGSLPFSIGAMIFHHFNNFKFDLLFRRKSLIIMAIIFIGNSTLAIIGEQTKYAAIITTICFYVNYLVNAAIIIALINNTNFFVSKQLDSKIGDYSYPIYLVHWQAGLVSSMLLFGEPIKGVSIQSAASFAFALLFCFLISFIIIRYVDKPIERVRNNVRQRAL